MTTEIDPLDYEAVVRRSQKVKLDIVDTLTLEAPVPKDPDDAKLLLNTLKALDSTAISIKRNSIEQDKGDTNKAFVESLEILVGRLGNANPFEKGNGGVAPDLDLSSIPEFETVPGEETIGLVSDNYNDFMKRMNPVMNSKVQDEPEDNTE